MFRLIAEANEKYGEYKSLLNTLEFDSSFFLDSVLLNESYKSTQIEGTRILQDEMYYLKYMEITDDNREIQNLKKIIEYGYSEIKQGASISLGLVNRMHEILLDSVRGAQKNPGQIRTTQNWIGLRGVGIEGATFIPPIPEEVQEESGVSVNVVSNIINQLVELGIIIPDSTAVKKGYRYQRI